MGLIFLGGETGGGGSPRLYQEGADFLVQGYAVTEPQLLAALNLPDGETVVRVPQSLWNYLPTRPRMKPFAEKIRGQTSADGDHGTSGLERQNWSAEEERELATWRARTSGLTEDEGQRAETVPGLIDRYIRLDRRGMSVNIVAGGYARSLLWPDTLTLMPPGRDLRVISESRMLVSDFAEDGTWARSEIVHDRTLARQCSRAFDGLRAISAQQRRHRSA